jgi:hypothetical protein
MAITATGSAGLGLRGLSPQSAIPQQLATGAEQAAARQQVGNATTAEPNPLQQLQQEIVDRGPGAASRAGDGIGAPQRQDQPAEGVEAAGADDDGGTTASQIFSPEGVTRDETLPQPVDQNRGTQLDIAV